MVASDAALEDRESLGLLSSQVSHASFDVIDTAFEAVLLWPRMEGDFLAGACVIACAVRTPCSDQKLGSAKSGNAPCVALLVCFLCPGLGLLVPAVAILHAVVVEPLELGRKLFLLPCFFTVVLALA